MPAFLLFLIISKDNKISGMNYCCWKKIVISLLLLKLYGFYYSNNLISIDYFKIPEKLTVSCNCHFLLK